MNILVDPYIVSYMQINFKWFLDLNVKPKIIPKIFF